MRSYTTDKGSVASTAMHSFTWWIEALTGPNSTTSNYNPDADTINIDASLWQVRIGARYDF